MSGAAQLPVYRPLTLGQILERVWRLLRGNFRTQAGIALIPAVAVFVSYGIVFGLFGFAILTEVLRGNQHPAMPNAALVTAGFAAFIVVHLTVLGLYMAAATYAGVKADCGIPATMAESYAVAWKRGWHYVGLILSIYGICFSPALLVEAMIGGAMAGLASSKELMPGVVLLIPIGVLLLSAFLIGGVVLGLRLSMAFPASVFETLSVGASIKRSWQLTRGALGRIFLVVLVVYAVLYVGIMIAMLAMMFVVFVIALAFSGASSHPGSHAIWALAICGGAIYLAIVSVFGACSWMGFAGSFSVIYNDQRLRIAQPDVAAGRAQE